MMVIPGSGRYGQLFACAERKIVKSLRTECVDNKIVAFCVQRFYYVCDLRSQTVIIREECCMNENRYLEYKESTKTSTWLKTVSAYANYEGGKIIFGVTDSGEVSGIADARKVCLDLENCLNDSIRPVPDYELTVQDDQTICLTVQAGRFKPYFYKGKVYKRNDTATVEADRMEYIRLILEGENKSFEELAASGQDFTFSYLEKEFADRIGVHKLDMDVLKTLELYTDNNGYNNAAALLADQNTFHGIDIVRFGDSIDRIMYREIIEHQSILKQYHEAIRVFRTYYQYEQIEGSQRITKEMIPEKAFREAIANALIHRTWDVPASIAVSMFPDRIEIRSPGGLPAGLSKEDYLNNQISLLRNPILGNIFFRLKYIEKFGTGIMRINYAYEKALVKPQYHISENSIRIVLPVLSAEEAIGDAESTVIRLLREHGIMSRGQIENETGWKKDRVIRILNALTAKNIVTKEGAARGTKYRLK